MIKLASWNVNSIHARQNHVLQWLEQNPMDVLALQELKCQDELFPIEPFIERGLEVVVFGQKSYNGVAFISKKEAVDVRCGIDNFADPQKRVIAANFGNLRVINVYVPNGQEVGSEKYDYKLAWFDAFNAYIKQQLVIYPKMVIVGDYNIAPSDSDVYDPNIWQDRILVSDKEREKFHTLLSLGFKDSFRLFEQEANCFSWWDYRGGQFRSNQGLRIDHILISDPLIPNCRRSAIDSAPRAWERPSDHAPVFIELDESA